MNADGDRRGLHICFEGSDGAGKTTQAQVLAAHIGAVLTREPGGTAVGSRIRSIVLDPSSPIDARTEALLMAADRAEHHAALVEPALSSGRHVVSDRGFYSTIAYQHFGRGLDAGELAAISSFATAGRHVPDIVVLLVIDEAAAVERRRRRGILDRFETEDERFSQRVRDGFRKAADSDPQRWLLIDGAGEVDEVAERVIVAVTGHPTAAQRMLLPSISSS